MEGRWREETVMLKNIDKIISSDLLKVMYEMGHGDELCIGDGNFPAAQCAKRGGGILIKADGHGVVALLKAILKLYPLDTYVDQPVTLMEKVPGDPISVPIWDEFADAISEEDARGAGTIQYVERYRFYEQAEKCYAVVLTSDSAQYGNIILKKGLVR
jgi:L-fucose mutarotase